MSKLPQNCLIIILCFCLFPSWASDDYKCEIEVKVHENVLMSSDSGKAILDKNDMNTSYKFKATSEFIPDSEGEWVEYLGGKTRPYKWEPEAIIKGERSKDGKSSIGTCSPKEENWGTEFKVKVNVRMRLHGNQNKPKIESADAEMDVIAPLIKIEKASFSENGGGNGFIIHDKFRGVGVSTPEFIKDDKTPEKDRSPIGYYSGHKPSCVVTFQALPESMKTITVKCEAGIFASEETELSISEGKAEGSVTAKEELKKKCRSGVEKAVWSFSVLGVKLSSLKEPMNISNCYVLLDEGSIDKPWKSLLRVAFDKWNFSGATSHDELMNVLSGGISHTASYNSGWNSETGQTGSLYIDQKKSPMPLSVAKMVEAFVNGDPSIICTEAAGLMEYAAAVLGSGGVSSRGINWKESKTITNAAGQSEVKTWSSGHAYCLYEEKVHDPVPKNKGPRNMSETQYIDTVWKVDSNRKEFTAPRGLSFSFEE